MRSSVCFTTALLFISWYSTLDSIVLMRPGTGEPTLELEYGLPAIHRYLELPRPLSSSQLFRRAL